MSETLSKEVIIINELGLHARSAAQISKLAAEARSGVTIKRDGEEADAKSIIDILTLACPKGTRITLSVDDPADVEILKNISNLIEKGFGE